MKRRTPPTSAPPRRTSPLAPRGEGPGVRTHPPCPATGAGHRFTTFEVRIAPRRVCLYCGHSAQPGEDPDGAAAPPTPPTQQESPQ